MHILIFSKESIKERKKGNTNDTNEKNDSKQDGSTVLLNEKTLKNSIEIYLHII